MKKLIAVAFGVFLSLTNFCNAQSTLKFGHINSNELFGIMPELKAADSTLAKFKATLDSQFKTMGAEYQGKISDYKSKEASMADPIKEAKQKEITDLEERIQAFQESAQTSLQKKQEELNGPIIKKAQDAINTVAKEKGYSYIFDSMPGGNLLFAQESDDILPLVKAKLGIK
jgi:outer membrane protein